MWLITRDDLTKLLWVIVSVVSMETCLDDVLVAPGVKEVYSLFLFPVHFSLRKGLSFKMFLKQM